MAGTRGVADLLKTVNVARERSDEHATLGILDDLIQGGAHLGLGLGETRGRSVGGVREKQVDARLSKAVDGAVVGRHAVDGRLVELEVARVHDGTLRSLDKDAECAGDRVRHGEEIHGHAAHGHVGATLDLTEFRCANAELGELALNETEGQLAREDGHLVVKILQQVRQGAGVVLVAMGDDDAAKLILVLQNVGVVGQYQVDTGLGIVGEHQAGVDQDHVLAAFEHSHVLTDAVEASQRDDLKRSVVLLCCGSHTCEQVLSVRVYIQHGEYSPNIQRSVPRALGTRDCLL